MSKGLNIKAKLFERFGIQISSRAMNIFISEYGEGNESIIQTKLRIHEDIDAFYDFIVNRTDIPLTLNANHELLKQYKDEMYFIGRSIVTLKNYAAGNEKIREALPEVQNIYRDYLNKAKELARSMGLPENFDTSIRTVRTLK